MITKKLIKTSTFALVFSLTLASCGVKMKPLTSSLVSSQPQPLELVGNQVPAVINVKFPAKWFPPKATLKITPILRYIGGQSRGETYVFQGEKVLGNNPVVSYNDGGDVTLHFSVPYVNGMDKSELYLTFEAYNDGDLVKLPPVKVGTGVISTSALATAQSAQLAFAPDGFERIIKDAYDADIMFKIQNADVRKSQLKDESVQDWTDIVQNAKETPNQDVSVEIQSYSSPDGGVKLNTKLSEQREKNTRVAIKHEFKKADLSAIPIAAHYTAQDWEGFRKLVEKSNIPDKNLIIRILEMYPNSEQREQQIKNLSSVFSKLAEDILPKLRRSRLVANIKIIGKSDAEIMQWYQKFPGRLSLEELLHAATLQTNDAAKEGTYMLIQKIYPKDYRAYNNCGVLAWKRGDVKRATEYFAKAQQCKNNPYTDLNEGLLALADGNISKAEQLITTGANVEEAAPILGLLYLKKGEYAKAEKAYGKTISNNAAVAQLLNMDYASAMRTLSKIAQPNGRTFYLMAILCARTNDVNGAISNLEKAITASPVLRYRAIEDLEFRNIKTEPSFQALVK